MRVKFPVLDNWILVTGIYGSPRWTLRKELWPALGEIAQAVNGLWLLVGDFNVMLKDDEKQRALGT